MLPGVVGEPSDEPEYVIVATLIFPPAVVGVGWKNSATGVWVLAFGFNDLRC